MSSDGSAQAATLNAAAGADQQPIQESSKLASSTSSAGSVTALK